MFFCIKCRHMCNIYVYRLDMPASVTGSASNIVFSDGLYDPWSSGGVLRDVSATAVAVASGLLLFYVWMSSLFF